MITLRSPSALFLSVTNSTFYFHPYDSSPNYSVKMKSCNSLDLTISDKYTPNSEVSSHTYVGFLSVADSVVVALIF